MSKKVLDRHPFLKTVETNGNASNREQIKITLLRIFNFSSILYFGVSVLLFYLSFYFFGKSQFRILIPAFYWAVLGLASLTALGYIFHIVFIFIKKKRHIRPVEFTVVSICVIVFLVYELIIFTITQQLDKNFKEFWEKHNGDVKVQQIENSLKCCGYDKLESRCSRRSNVQCYSVINKNYFKHQYPIAFSQMAFTIVLFIYLLELFSKSLMKKKKQHNNSEKKQREMPLSPDQL